MVSLHTGDNAFLFLLSLSSSITENYRIVFYEQGRKKENSMGLKGGVAKLNEVGPNLEFAPRSLQRSCHDHARQESCYYTWQQAGKRQERKWTQQRSKTGFQEVGRGHSEGQAGEASSNGQRTVCRPNQKGQGGHHGEEKAQGLSLGLPRQG